LRVTDTADAVGFGVGAAGRVLRRKPAACYPAPWQGSDDTAPSRRQEPETYKVEGLLTGPPVVAGFALSLALSAI
jgi:hypothetical protein